MAALSESIVEPEHSTSDKVIALRHASLTAITFSSFISIGVVFWHAQSILQTDTQPITATRISFQGTGWGKAVSGRGPGLIPGITSVVSRGGVWSYDPSQITYGLCHVIRSYDSEYGVICSRYLVLICLVHFSCEYEVKKLRKQK